MIGHSPRKGRGAPMLDNFRRRDLPQSARGQSPYSSRLQEALSTAGDESAKAEAFGSEAPKADLRGDPEPSRSGRESVSKLIVGPDIKLKGAEITDCDTLVVEGRVEASMDSRVIQIAVLGDLDDAAVHRSLHATFDHQRVAVGDLGALQLDVRTDDQLAHAFTAGSGGFRITAQVGLRRFAPEGLRLCGFVTGRTQRFLQPAAVRRLPARGLRKISPAKIVQHRRSSSLSRAVTDHSRAKIRDPKCITFSNAHARRNSRAKSCDCRKRSATDRSPSSLSSDATSSAGLKRLFTMKVARRAKATAMTPTVKTEVLEHRQPPCQIRVGRTSIRIRLPAP